MGKLSEKFWRAGNSEKLEFLGIAMVLENIKRNDDGLRRF